jgi:hypothetical protein
MKKALIVAVLAGGILAAPANGQTNGRLLLMPGVTYERQVQFTSHGPVAIHVLTAPRPGGLWSLRPALSNGAILGRERVTAMQRTVSTTATAAGVNGDLFAWDTGRPSGILMQGGALMHQPLPERSSIGISSDGTLRVERVRMFGTWRGTGQRRPLVLNHEPAPNGVALYTPAWGPQTPAVANAVEAVLQPFPAAAPNVDLTGTLTQVTPTSSGTAIPPDGAVLVARGTAAARLVAEAPPGTGVTIRLLLNPDWGGVTDAIGGGPVLVRDAKPVFRHFELFSTEQLSRNPRTAVGQLADGRIVLLVVDGRQPGYSVGMTNFELAQTLVRLGAVTGSGLDAGGSSTMAFDGALLNKPSDPGGERAVSEGLFVLYTGVYVAPPTEGVLSPNGDAVAEVQGLAYKLVRPSNVVVSLVGPDGVERRLEEGAKTPGTYRFSWNGARPDGAPEVEGRWRLSVAAVDDAGQTSTADRPFSLNRTLGSLSVSPSLLRVRPQGPVLNASFTLTRQSDVRVVVESAAGAVVAVAARVRLAPGPQTLAWNGRVSGGRLAHTGRYVLRVTATNELGKMDLAQPFSVRRAAVRSQTRR